jgi:ribosomal protein L7Ae-like RNA K-turn-binding protein
MSQQTLGFLGILFRGHSALIGEEAYQARSRMKLAFLAFDASENTKKEALSACEAQGIKPLQSYSKSELGNALGYENVSFLVVTSKKAATKICLLEGENNEQ